MHIGLSIPQYGRFADADFAARAATTAERIGYDSLWVGDRLLVATAPRSQYPGGGGNAPEEHQVFLDPLALLTVAATVTSRVRLGSSTLNALWQPPVLLARSLTTLDHVSGGAWTSAWAWAGPRTSTRRSACRGPGAVPAWRRPWTCWSRSGPRTR